MDDRFVTIGSTNFRKSNIKEFGMGSEGSPHGGLLVGVVSLFRGEGWLAALTKYNGQHEIPYLFVKTFQGENHKFFQGQVNFEEALHTLRT